MSEHKHLKYSRKSVKKARPRIVRRWHRRLGLLSAIAVVLLSVTGLLLNHVNQVYDTNSYVSSEWLLDWYGVEAPENVYSHHTQERNSFIWADGTVLVNQAPALFNQSQLLGVYAYQDIHHLLTKSNILLFTQKGEFIESVDYPTTKPVKAVFIGDTANKVILGFDSGVVELDLDPLTFRNLETEKTSPPKTPLSLNKHTKNDLESNIARQNLLLKSTVLLDLHSGRILGSWGVLLMDFFAICFLLLAVSGVVAWRRSLKRR